MKKILMATTALVSVGIFAGQALAADKPTVKVGGFSQWFIGASSDDSATRGGSHGIALEDTELTITAKGKADNGLEYGVKFELEAADDDGDKNSDENVIWVKGSWGTVEIGSEDGALDRMAVTAPAGWGIAGHATGADFTDLGGNLSSMKWDSADTGDANKINYFGSFGAVSVGASFVPYSANENHIDTKNDANQGAYNSVISVAAVYSGEASGMKFKVGGGITQGDDDEGATKNDLDSWEAGVSVSTGGWTVGFHHTDDDASGAAAGTADTTANIVGVQYTTGPWTVGAHYIDQDAAGVDTKGYSAGFTYAVAPGLKFGGEVTGVNGEGANSDGTAYILSTAVSF